ncbi:hypothetical protein FRB93_001166 [Tulasnella sp. JGI-2019a]|nr:hypothetical protein FRB93_001166 [Tulasnella sp. JGI-2019a]
METFPPEIWIVIVEALGRPSRPFAYRLPKGCTNSLAQLCLVNHWFRQLVESQLYARPFITPENLHMFYRTLVLYEGSPIRARSDDTVFRPPNGEYTFFDGIPPYYRSEKAELVKSLALVAATGPYALRQMVSILTVLHPTLERLFLDWSQIDTGRCPPELIRETVQGFQSLKQFCVTQHQKLFYNVPIKSSKTLRSVATMGHPLNHLHIIMNIQSVETIINAYPSVNDFRDSAGNVDVIRSHVQELVVMVAKDRDAERRYIAGLYRLLSPRVVPKEKLKIIRVHNQNPYYWVSQFFNAVADGTIWHEERIS